MAEKIDKPSDIDFARAIVENIPEPSNKDLLRFAGVAYVTSRAIKRAAKKL